MAELNGELNGANNGAVGTNPTATDAGNDKGEEKTYSQADFDKALQSETGKRVADALKTAQSEWEKSLGDKLEEAKNEGARLAKLSAEERRKEEDKAERENFEKEKAEFAHKSLVAETVKQLGEKGIPVEFAEMAAGQSAEAAQANIKLLETSWNKAIEAEVSKRLGGKTPNTAGSEKTAVTGGFFDTIKENQRH